MQSLEHLIQGDALSCVRMATEMQERMKTLREKWWNQGIQLPFEIRCGIHTGMANVGNYGSEGFMEYSAIGLNTNLASRLEQVCEPGEIYLSHAIVLHINNFIASKSLYYAIPALSLSFFITQITLVASFRYFSNAFTTEVLKSSNVGKNLQ